MPYLGYFEPKIQKYPIVINFHLKFFIKVNEIIKKSKNYNFLIYIIISQNIDRQKSHNNIFYYSSLKPSFWE